MATNQKSEVFPVGPPITSHPVPVPKRVWQFTTRFPTMEAMSLANMSLPLQALMRSGVRLNTCRPVPVDRR